MVSEKIDGTNASVLIVQTPLLDDDGKDAVAFIPPTPGEPGYFVFAGSRNRWLNVHDDNYGFANWVKENALELLKLGPGHHFGEWWGYGINRGYGLPKGDRRFSLFNVEKWGDALSRPAICHVVPTLYRGPFSTSSIDAVVAALGAMGSLAAPGYMQPEGVVIYHTSGNLLFKKTVVGDELHKSQEGHVRAAPKAKVPRDPSKGGRRVVQVPINFPDRRKHGKSNSGEASNPTS